MKYIYLSKTELETLQLVAEELDTNQIADKLFISIYTVRWRVSKILAKATVHSRDDLINLYQNSPKKFRIQSSRLSYRNNGIFYDYKVNHYSHEQLSKKYKLSESNVRYVLKRYYDNLI
jgi:DNA-binding CsgD family transcriptional regulator